MTPTEALARALNANKTVAGKARVEGFKSQLAAFGYEVRPIEDPKALHQIAQIAWHAIEQAAEAADREAAGADWQRAATGEYPPNRPNTNSDPSTPSAAADPEAVALLRAQFAFPTPDGLYQGRTFAEWCDAARAYLARVDEGG